MPADVRYGDFVRWFSRHGVSVSINKSSHVKMSRVVDGVTLKYVAVVHNNKVAHVYLAKARRALKLSEADGYKDRVFLS